MASALLASRNEPYWGEGKVYMRQNPNSNPNWRPNPNPNPKHKTKRIPDQPPTYDPSSIRLSDEPAGVATAVSDDSSSLNRKFANRRDGGYVSFNVSSFSRKELKDLKKQLVSELNQVRRLSDRIESRDFQSRSGYSTTGGGYGGREVTSLNTRPQPPPPEFHLPENDGREMPIKVSGSKRSSNLLPGRDPKRAAVESVGAAAVASVQPATDRLLVDMMKKCMQLLTKLMKQKNCWIFNTPVDVVGMGLHDYHQIIKHPMDLGTVKTKLRGNQYDSPLHFADDVRLTFNNALAYNPSAHEVYIYAQNLLSNFEDMFHPAYRSYDDERQRIVNWAEKMKQKSQGGSKKSAKAHTPLEHHRERKQSFEEKEVIRGEDQKEMGGMPRSAWNQNHRRPAEKKRPPEPVSLPPPTMPSSPAPVAAPAPAPSGSGTIRMGRQPKPRAKDKDKRDMSLEEKQKLSLGLQNLPPEKMEQVVHIIKKRNANLAQDGDEIEVDIEVVDNETLWELDRFVGYCKKTASKMKRQALAAANQNTSFEAAPTGGDKYSVEEEEETQPEGATFTHKKNRKGETGGGGMDEEIDIGEDMPATNFPPVEIEKDVGGGCASRSSSSSSSSSSDDDSSSNSDSDSGSSSGSDSDDGDNAQSPGGRGVVESKATPPS